MSSTYTPDGYQLGNSASITGSFGASACMVTVVRIDDDDNTGECLLQKFDSSSSGTSTFTASVDPTAPSGYHYVYKFDPVCDDRISDIDASNAYIAAHPDEYPTAPDGSLDNGIKVVLLDNAFDSGTSLWTRTYQVSITDGWPWLREHLYDPIHGYPDYSFVLPTNATLISGSLDDIYNPITITATRADETGLPTDWFIPGVDSLSDVGVPGIKAHSFNNCTSSYVDERVVWWDGESDGWTGSGSGSGSGSGTGSDSGSGGSGSGSGSGSGEGCAAGYHDDGTGNCVDDADGATACATGYHWSGTACISNTPAIAIPAPIGCVNSATGGTAALVFQPLTDIPADATSAILQHFNGSTYDDVKTLTLSEAASPFLYNLNPATILTFKVKFPTSDAGFNYASASGTITESCCTDGGGGTVTPDVPDAPTVVKSCEDGNAVVSVVLPEGATSLEIARDDAEDTVIATLTASGDFTDSTVSNIGTYKYRARSVGLLDSDWSDWSNEVTFISSSLTIAITAPAASAELVLRNDVTFTLTDSNEPSECDESAAPCVDDADIKVYVDGVEVTDAITLQSGTPRNGTYKIEQMDSRYFSNGAHTILVTAKDINCCHGKATVAVTVNNTFSNNVIYDVVKTIVNPPAGTNFYKANLIVKSFPLHDLPQHRAWLRTGVATSDTGKPTWASDSNTVKSDYFDSLQRVKMLTYTSPTSPDYDQLYANPTLSPRGSKLYWVLQRTPYETQTSFDTGLTDVIQFARVGLITDADADYWALATGASAAKIYQFVDGLWVEKYDLSDAAYDAADAISFTADTNAVYVATAGGEIIAIDRDSGQATANIAPRGETRQVKVLFTDGAKVYWLFTDATSTKCYTYSPGNLQTAFTVDAVITKIKPVTLSGIAMLAATDGTNLYGILGSNVATVTNTISDTITATDANGDTYIVGTSTGKVYSVGETTTLLTTMSGAANDVTSWNWDGEGNLDIAGTDSDILYEQSRAGAWGASHEIAPLSGESIDALNTFMAYEKTITPAVGTFGEVGYVPAVVERKLFIGTGNDGTIVTLEISNAMQAQGSILVSRLSHFGITPKYANII